MGELMTGLFVDQIYGHLHQQHLLSEERKGWKGTDDLLYTDRAILRDVRSRNQNLVIT